MTQAEVDDTLKRIQEHKGVQGYLIINNDGIPIRSNLEASLTQQYAALIKSLSDKARSTIREIDPTNELVFFRMRTKKHEVLVAPDDEMSFIINQPLYNRFSLDRRRPASPTILPSSYHGPPSFNYRPTVSATQNFTHDSPALKQKFYTTYSKPSHPVNKE